MNLFLITVITIQCTIDQKKCSLAKVQAQLEQCQIDLKQSKEQNQQLEASNGRLKRIVSDLEQDPVVLCKKSSSSDTTNSEASQRPSWKFEKCSDKDNIEFSRAYIGRCPIPSTLPYFSNPLYSNLSEQDLRKSFKSKLPDATHESCPDHRQPSSSMFCITETQLQHRFAVLERSQDSSSDFTAGGNILKKTNSDQLWESLQVTSITQRHCSVDLKELSISVFTYVLLVFFAVLLLLYVIN